MEVSERGGKEGKDQRWQGNKSEEYICEISLFQFCRVKEME